MQFIDDDLKELLSPIFEDPAFSAHSYTIGKMGQDQIEDGMEQRLEKTEPLKDPDRTVYDFASLAQVLLNHMDDLTDDQLEAVEAVSETVHRLSYEKMDERNLWDDDEE